MSLEPPQHEPATAPPRFFRGILPIDRAQVIRDIVAGITLAAMNIPQAMGYTKIAGTPPVTGLYTLLLPVIAFAIFGASRYLVVAADSATAAILAVGVAPLAVAGSPKYLALASMIALLTAACLLLARILRLGFLSDFLSRTVLIGFLTGVGVQVAIAVLPEMLGIHISSHRTIDQLVSLVRDFPRIHPATLGVSLGVVAVVVGTRRLAPHWPGPLFAVAGAIALSSMLDFSAHGINVLGPIEAGLPRLSLPDVTWDEVVKLLPVAGACFVMVIAQSSATARAYATRHRQVLDQNRDLIGLCAADAAAGFSGTFVVNGSPTQTAMVEASGGRSQIAHLTTAASVALVLLFLTGPLRFLPTCVLGALVFVVALRLMDFAGMRELQRRSPTEFALAVLTAAMVVALGVEYGILLALALSLLDHVRHGYRAHTAVIVRDPHDHWRMEPVAAGAISEPGLVMMWFGADIYYANANHFAEQVRLLVGDGPPTVRWLVVDSGAITGIDYSAGSTLRELHHELEKRGVVLALTRINSALRADLDCFGLTELIKPVNIFNSRKACLAAFHESRQAEAE
ncbi:transporter [Verrucomicrobia bacterium SCGC AG-212-E04]|nr:transporter [Verrucomicrobia bacterium SCGC AG-212-E04]